jgi:hypothetical protein
MKKFLWTIPSIFLLSSCGASFIAINSQPAGLKAYVVSKFEAEKNPKILSDTTLLKKHPVNVGLTPVTTKVKVKKYKVAVVSNGRIEIRDVDALPNDTSHVFVSF